MTASAPTWTAIRRLGLALVAAAGITLLALPAAEAADPNLTMSPAPTNHPYSEGQTITLTVGPNGRFSPNTRIEVLECAAPKGALPVDDSTCDGNTAQYGSVLVASDGSFQVPSYTLYQLPNAALGEQNNHAPVCNATQECVLYLGQDQNDFTKPKMFSATFTVGSTSPAGTAPTGGGGSDPGGGSASHGGTGAGSASGTGSASATGSGAVDPSVSLGGSSGGTGTADPSVSAQPAGVLAFTGVDQLRLLVGIGVVLTLVGTVGIHARRRTRL